MNAGKIIAWVKTAYDKIALVVVLSGLLLSVAILSVRVAQAKYELSSARWDRPPAVSRPPVSSNLIVVWDAIDQVVAPEPASVRAGVMVAEERVACVTCGRPIPERAPLCPFKNCGAPQPVEGGDVPKDANRNGIPDEWERKYGLSVTLDESGKDPDNDGFSNYEEYAFGTNPTDPASHPPPVMRLRVKRTGEIVIPLMFIGVQRPSDTETVFTLKNLTTARDYYVHLDESVGETGYKVVAYEPKTVEVVRNNLRIPEDVSRLTVEKGGRRVVLTKDVKATEWAAQLLWLADQSKYQVRIGDGFSLKDSRYKVVDIRKESVVVSDASGKETRVPFESESAAPGAPSDKEAKPAQP